MIRAACTRVSGFPVAIAAGAACALSACRPVSEANPPRQSPADPVASQRFQWPQWGGPRRDFHVPDIVLSLEWPPDGPPIVWSRALGDGGARLVELQSEGAKTAVREAWATRKMRIIHRNAVRIGDFIYATSGDVGPAVFTTVNARDATFA